MKLALPHLTVGTGLRNLLLALMAVGLCAGAVGLWVDPDRSWKGLLIAFFYATGLGLGAALFMATQYVTGAGWSIAFRRVPEAMTAILPFAGLGVVALGFGVHNLYEWSHGAEVVEDRILAAKASWLNVPFFLVRIAGYLLIWILLSRLIVMTSRRQDADGDVVHTRRNVRNSVLLIVLGVITGCLASFDLLMSLQPHWYSTMFGVLTVAGIFLSALAAIAVFVVVMRRLGWGGVFTEDHLYDLGRLLLAFSVFWVYLWASQHMLIWYAHLPEETAYFQIRHTGGWGLLSIANVLLNWTVPFLLMLSRDARRSDRMILLAASSILAGHWLDLCIIVVPSTPGAAAILGPLELLPTLGALSLFVLISLRSFSRQHGVPIRDPYLVESMKSSSGPS